MTSQGRHGKRVEERDWSRDTLGPDRLDEGRSRMRKIRGSLDEREKDA